MRWLRDNWPLIIVGAVALVVVGGAMWLKGRSNAAAERAENQIEQADLEALPEIVTRPVRVERSSRGVVDQVESELDEASIPRPEDDAGGDTAARRMDDSWRSGIGRLRDEASRY